MDGVQRVDLKGHLPKVEYRPDSQRFFVVFPELKVELVMGLVHRWTACEIGLNVYHGTPFYTHIPCVDYRAPFPRPWLVYPTPVVESLDLVFLEN